MLYKTQNTICIGWGNIILLCQFLVDWWEGTDSSNFARWYITAIQKMKTPMDSLRKLRFLLEYLTACYNENYTPEKHLPNDEYLSVWKGWLSFHIYIPQKPEQYDVKIFMLCERKTGYLLNFIIYTDATTKYPDQPDLLTMKFDESKSPSKLLFSLLHDYLHKVCCVTLDNYYNSPKLA